MDVHLFSVVPSAQFQIDLENSKKEKRHSIAKFKVIVNLLAKGIKLSRSYRDHDLRGKWQGFRELHIEPDWLLIYLIDGDKLRLIRLGTHEELFN